MSSEPQVPPELAGFLQQLRSLVPPPAWCVPEDENKVPGNRMLMLDAHDVKGLENYLAHLSNHGRAILAQVEQVILGLAKRANDAENRQRIKDVSPEKSEHQPRPILAPDSCAEDALFALMQYLLSLRGLL